MGMISCSRTGSPPVMHGKRGLIRQRLGTRRGDSNASSATTWKTALLWRSEYANGARKSGC